jgi:hypothetical protein
MLPHPPMLRHLLGDPASRHSLPPSRRRIPSACMSSTLITCDLVFPVRLFFFSLSCCRLTDFAVTQRQYDTTKDVILDILGYGVPPEYLVDCGISKETIYYVFTELNLRLPSNLVTVGIPPYPLPQDVMASIPPSQSTLPLSPSVTAGRSVDGNITRPGSVGHSPFPPALHGV